jgi:hypothetical protein
MQRMMKIVILLVILSGIVAVATFSFFILNGQTSYETLRLKDTYSRFAFLEIPKADFSCLSCQRVTTLIDELYETGEYPFYYVLLPHENVRAATRTLELNLWGFPTIYFDGGYEVIVGGNTDKSSIVEKIASAVNSQRSNITVTTSAEVSQTNSTIKLSTFIQNNETINYSGRLVVYLTAINSTDQQGNPIHFSLVDFPIGEQIDIPPKGNITIETVANESGLPLENIMLYSVVFNEKAQIRYSQLPNKNPFDAHFIDAICATRIYEAI